MSAIDISRHLFQPEKRYSGVLRFQGRVLLDSDENERSFIEKDDLRRTLIDVVCARGARGDGFKIDNIRNTAGKLDFDVLPGAMYLGGMRFEAVASASGANEAFLIQTDWLQMGVGGDGRNAAQADQEDKPAFPTTATLGGTVRHDLVLIEGFEQAVTATEDSEFLERGLGGPDTTARVRRMRRVRVLPNVGSTCATAFNSLITALEAGGNAAFNRETCELAGTTGLQITFDNAGTTDDPCAPPERDGYLGAANETIRVAITEPGRFVWSFGNAAPLYRVQALDFTPPVGPTTKRLIRFMSLPPDQASQPLAGDVVEIAPWGTLLPNGEKLAEERSFFAVVDTPYDPETQSILISTQVPIEWTNWLASPAGQANRNPRDPAETRDYFYLRVWRGEPNVGAIPGQAINLAAPVPLGATGLAARFSGNGRRGDYWIVSARPHTPTTLVPWNFDLAPGVRPAGPRRFYAPLAVIEWRIVAGALTRRLHDCRERFRPLCEQGGCCEITVGDGETSHGHVTSIQEAVELLPEEGGKICVLKGTHRGPVLIDGGSNIIIEGCGPLTRIVAPAGSLKPLFSIRDTTGLTIRDMALRAPEGLCIAIENSSGTNYQFAVRARDIALERLLITSRDAPAVFFKNGIGFRMSDCSIDHESLQVALAPGSTSGLTQAVLLLGRNMLVERCDIRHDTTGGRARRALGGIHVLGGSRGIAIHENRVAIGNGIGVRLGSVRFVPQDTTAPGGVNPAHLAAPLASIYDADWTGQIRLDLPAGVPAVGGYTLTGTVIVKPDGCIEIDPGGPDGGGGGPPLVPVADPPIRELLIDGNRIEAMGSSGIGVDRFFDIDVTQQMIIVENARMLSNRIIRCAAQGAPEALRQGGLSLYGAVGGITLAATRDLAIRDNRIAECGLQFIHPICGVFVLISEGLFIERNRIEDNGRRANEGDLPPPGRRGGIVVNLALVPTDTVEFGPRSITHDSGIAAIKVEGNTVVQPEGRALRVMAFGAAHVHGNRLVSRGAAADTALLLRFIQQFIVGSTIGRYVTTTGSPLVVSQSDAAQLDAILSLLGGAVVSIIAPLPSIELLFLVIGKKVAEAEITLTDFQELKLIGGNVLFNDNQTAFDGVARGSAFSVCSVLILTLDDAVMDANQCDCDLTDDFFLTNALVTGFSVRVTGNRFKSLPTNVLLSAATLGYMNMTATNQGTKCFLVSASSIEKTDQPNHVFIRAQTGNVEICGGRLTGIGTGVGNVGVGSMIGGRYMAAVQP